eukprot:CAMPEP_0172567858 /NCGR_PEP_ID=MMETSP1067-20121228/117509_1 /TAXON_ID=265564 ORGANISM="Thalassiosira punctigera, Strain Tpunct2005C2" /NCGR_SAMPLE_ID=MMETSP1067 /ASSEMBLY_ACC=CAM_ASM_000444 /LENGTH=84 /DNA_ID=CAMNT_0013359299 /DNA_START=1 /DNA_END=251 /DNA_ORIENTATION=-
MASSPSSLHDAVVVASIAAAFFASVSLNFSSLPGAVLSDVVRCSFPSFPLPLPATAAAAFFESSSAFLLALFLAFFPMGFLSPS